MKYLFLFNTINLAATPVIYQNWYQPYSGPTVPVVAIVVQKEVPEAIPSKEPAGGPFYTYVHPKN